MSEISVIIPTNNRAAQLHACLKALSLQTQAATDFDVIVIDDASIDGTSEMLTEIETPFVLRVIRQEGEGQCAARNRGIAASSRYCLFLDDDIVPCPGMVAEHLQAQRASGGVVAIGQLTMRVSASADWYARGFNQRWSDHYQHLNQKTRQPAWQDCYSGNFSAPRKALLDVGGYATDLQVGFDVELGYRLQQCGISFVYLPTACGEHQHDKTGSRLLHEDELAGRTMFELIRRHADLLPELLGRFWDTSQRAIILRRLLLSLHIKPRHLTYLSLGLRSEHWNREWFRFVSSYAYWYGVQQTAPDSETWRRLTYGTPVLMYHAFGMPGEPPSRYVIPKRRFVQQMAWLKLLGYHVLDLEEYLLNRHEGCLPPARSVIITIDDGYADIYSVAYPILKRYSFPATIFLVSDSVGGANRWDEQAPLRNRALMSWTEIRELLHGGINFGAHTRTHPKLTDLSPDQARAEIAGSRAELEQNIKRPIQLFSYPHGEYDATLRSMVEQVGFLGACTVRPGMNSYAIPNFEIRRTEVHGTDSFLHFALALWLDDDHPPLRRQKKRGAVK